MFSSLLGQPKSKRVFPVKASHEVLPDGGGVQFNVETVTPCEDAARDVPDGREALLKMATGYYAEKPCPFGSSGQLPPILEACSAEEGVRYMSGGFARAVITAFAEHRPLILRPDDIWAVIAYGHCKHVEKHAEELRSKFVAHEGKKELHINVDHLRLGVTPAEVWESTVFPAFSAQIKAQVGEEVHATLASRFSTSLPVDVAAAEITLMAATKHYFAFSMWRAGGCRACCPCSISSWRRTRGGWTPPSGRAW